MKLFYLANIRIPTEKAHGVQIAKMCEALADQGIDLTLVVPKKYTPIKENVFDYYKVKNNFKIKEVSSINLIAFDFLLGRLSFYLETLVFNVQVKKLIKQEKPDVLYTREHVLSWLMSKYHQNIFLETHVYPDNNFYKKCLSKITGVIVITNRLKELVSQHHKKVLLAPDGVDLKQFDLEMGKSEARKRLNLPLDKKVIVYLGHLYVWKGVKTLAGAQKYLPNDYQIYFTGGTKNDIIRFKSQIKKENLKVNIIGHRPYQEMPIWLKAADAVVMTGNPQEAISRLYTSPMKLFEYMASKRPIVASDLPSIREILSEANSILVKAGDPQAMAGGIKIASEDPELAQRLASRAYQDVHEYSWDKRAGKIKEFLEA